MSKQTKVNESLLAAFNDIMNSKHPNLFQEAAKKKLDAVGKENKDIDNDGDTDTSDEYLHNRRKAIGKAMKEEVDQIDEAAIPEVFLTKATKAMKNTYGPGRVTAKDGVISHTNKYGETNSHAYDPKKKQQIGPHIGTITVGEEFEQIDEAHQVGDPVRIHAPGFASHGKEGTVSKILPDGRHEVTFGQFKMGTQSRISPQSGLLGRPGETLSIPPKKMGGTKTTVDASALRKLRKLKEEVGFSEAELTYFASISNKNKFSET